MKTTESEEVPTELNFYAYASRVSLDVIASAGSHTFSVSTRSSLISSTTGFGYETHAIEKGNDSELARSFSEFADSNQGLRVLHLLVYFFPILRHLVNYPLRYLY